MGDVTTRRALKPILLDKPEMAAALGHSSWRKMVDTLTDSMGEELNASFGKEAVEKCLRELTAEAQKPGPIKGEAQASALLGLTTYHEVMAQLQGAIAVTIDEDPASKEQHEPMEVTVGATSSEGLGVTTPPIGEGQPSASTPIVMPAAGPGKLAAPRTPTRPPNRIEPVVPGGAGTGAAVWLQRLKGYPSSTHCRSCTD